MKCCIIGFNNLYLMQYLYKYTNILDDQNIDYDVIYWNRENLAEKKKFKGTVIEYVEELNSYQPIRKKIKSFIKYSKFVRKKIKKNKYDRIIVLTTQTAMSLLDILLFKYDKKYIFDYRDVTKELTFSIYKKIVKSLIHRSKYTMMSSPGFMELLGVENEENVQLAHNTQNTRFEDKRKNYLNQNETITISFWGTIRQLEFNKKLCEILKNDNRFIIYFHGKGMDQELKKFCDEKKITNIYFTGRYDNDKIKEFVKDTDIIHCLYDNDRIQKMAMPVKAYDAINYRIPVLISHGSTVEAFYKDCKCALALDIDDGYEIKEKIYSWYRSLSFEKITHEFELLEENVGRDDDEFKRKLLSFTS